MVIIISLEKLLQKKDARRIFGKKELEIIFKQLDGSLLTQSEKNRLSRDIRPKFEFIEQAADFASEFRLRKNQNNMVMIDKAVDVILGDELNDEILSILLFGSFADKTSTKRSDIDICVVFRKDISLKKATRFRAKVSGNLPEKIDIQVFNILPQKLKRSIARNHRILYRSSDYDDINFSINYLKDDDYFIRMNNVLGVEA